MSKNSTIFYHEWLLLIEALPDQSKLKLYELIFSFDENNLPEINDAHLKSVFDYISNKIISNNKKYKEKCDKARESANARWSKKDDANACERKKRIKTHYDNVNDNDNDIISKDIIIKKIPKKEIQIPDFVNAELWNGFLEMRIKAKAKPTDLAIKGIVNKLIKFEDNKKGNANIALENSIENNWKGVFEPKNNKKESRLAWKN